MQIRECLFDFRFPTSGEKLFFGLKANEDFKSKIFATTNNT